MINIQSKKISRTVIALTIGILIMGLRGAAQTAVIGYTDQTAFLNALTNAGYVTVHEGFEDDAPWGTVRSTISGGNFTAPGITSFGITWTANNSNSGITTSSGASRTGNWGFYSLPHGDYENGTGCDTPGNCGDGFIGTRGNGLFGVGGWIKGTFGGKLQLIIDGDRQNPVEFPAQCDPGGENCVDPAILDNQHRFFGVIDTDSFTSFEFSEREGTAEDQKFIWGDDFTLGMLAQPPVISSVEPSSGSLGTQVAINGTGFGMTQGDGLVIFFDGIEVLTVSSWNTVKIVCTVPEGAQSGCVRVATSEGTSNCVTFNVVPRFGDVNGDESVDLLDAILVCQVMAGTRPTATFYIANEVTPNGKIGLEEAGFILQKISGLKE